MLVVVPTRFELNFIRVEKFSSTAADFQVCGFGPVAAGIRTLELIHEQNPDRVVLMGIAGRYDASLEIGRAYFFDVVSMFGIGAGNGKDFLSNKDLQLPQLEFPDGEIVYETIRCGGTSVEKPSREILTVVSAAATADEVQQRRARFPAAMAEDMEAFSVALACKITGVELTIIRGISNEAGQRSDRMEIAGSCLGGDGVVNRFCQVAN